VSRMTRSLRPGGIAKTNIFAFRRGQVSEGRDGMRLENARTSCTRAEICPYGTTCFLVRLTRDRRVFKSKFSASRTSSRTSMPCTSVEPRRVLINALRLALRHKPENICSV